jgi:hypothetical protein
MNTSNQLSTFQYLDKALSGLKDLGLSSSESEPAPIIALLNKISDLDEDKVMAIARTLNEATFFNEVVREEISGMRVGERYEEITAGFNSIRDDAKSLVEQYSDGKLDTMERVSNIWMKMTRGDIASRFDNIRDVYIEVARDTDDQIKREQTILDAYLDFRGALKNAEVLALDVLNKAEAELRAAKAEVEGAVAKVEAYTGDDAAERARLELARDEDLRALQTTDKRYQIAKDLSDNLTIGYNTSEVVMARLVQTKNAKERIYAQSVSFFSTNETVLTALTATFTGMFGLHESTETLNAMKKGIEDSLTTLSEVGGKVQEAALRAGYGPTVSAAAVKTLVDSVVSYQERSQDIITEMRKLATENSEEIRQVVEDGKRRLTQLAKSGASAALDLQ